MKSRYTLYIYCACVMILAACQNEDLTSYAQKSDNYGLITFGVQPEQMVTRSSNYDKNLYPDAMGVFCDGITDLDNAKAEMNEDGSFHANIYWENVTFNDSYKFYAYMPYVSYNTEKNNVSLTLNVKDGTGDNEKTDANGKKLKTYEDKLLFPFTMPNKGTETDPVESGLTFVQKDAPLICREPQEVQMYSNVTFNMSQTLTGYKINFALGQKMDAVRDITIKQVYLKEYEGETVPETGTSVFYKSGVCSRTYTRVDTVTNNVTKKGTWKGNDITWVLTDDNKCSSLQNIEVFNNPVDNVSTTLKLNTTTQQWGDTFYMIPITNFTPYIEVTYDVTLNDNGETTRKTVVSAIQLNTANFSNYNPKVAGETGKIYPINIYIVPKYLYVLADGDQIAGQIEIPSN